MRSACSAPADLIACRIAIMPLGLTPRRLRPATSERKLEPLTMATWPPDSLTSICVLRRHDRLAIAERGGLRRLRRLGDAHVERAVRDGDRRDLHVLSDDDGAGARVDDDARAVSGSISSSPISAMRRVTLSCAGRNSSTERPSRSKAIGL